MVADDAGCVVDVAADDAIEAIVVGEVPVIPAFDVAGDLAGVAAVVNESVDPDLAEPAIPASARGVYLLQQYSYYCSQHHQESNLRSKTE